MLRMVCLLLPACTSTQSYPPTAPSTGRRTAPAEAQFNLTDIAKSDIDAVAEVHFRESIASAKLLTEKLYRRNPRELKKSDVPTPEAGVARAFDPGRGWRFTQLSNQRGIDALSIAFRADFTGDRVFAFGVGIGSMIAQAYNDKSAFYLTDTLDAQRLYNAARNLEIAAWKLANAKGPQRRAPAPQQRDGTGARQSVVRAGIRQADRLPGHLGTRDGATDESHDPPLFAGSRDGGVPAALNAVRRACASCLTVAGRRR